MSRTILASIQITSHYSLMQYTILINEQHFIAGRPLVILLPLAVKESTNEDVDYLIKELHILVYNVSNNINGNMYTEINTHEYQNNVRNGRNIFHVSSSSCTNCLHTTTLGT
jgi:hypothetical protein